MLLRNCFKEKYKIKKALGEGLKTTNIHNHNKMNISLNYYHEALNYATFLINCKYKHNSLYNAYDVVHEAILKESLVNENYRKIVFAQFKQLTSSHKTIEFKEDFEQKKQEQTLCCKVCGETKLENYFVKITNNALGKMCYLNTCKLCQNKKRRKTDRGDNYIGLSRKEHNKLRTVKDISLLTDRYIKQLLTRRHKNLVVTPEMIITHRENLLIKRALKNKK